MLRGLGRVVFLPFASNFPLIVFSSLALDPSPKLFALLSSPFSLRPCPLSLVPCPFALFPFPFSLFPCVYSTHARREIRRDVRPAARDAAAPREAIERCDGPARGLPARFIHATGPGWSPPVHRRCSHQEELRQLPPHPGVRLPRTSRRCLRRTARKRMQGKSCFNFKSIQPEELQELSALTKEGLDRMKVVKLPWATQRKQE